MAKKATAVAAFVAAAGMTAMPLQAEAFTGNLIDPGNPINYVNPASPYCHAAGTCRKSKAQSEEQKEAERKRAEEQRQAREEHWQNIYQAIADGKTQQEVQQMTRRNMWPRANALRFLDNCRSEFSGTVSTIEDGRALVQCSVGQHKAENSRKVKKVFGATAALLLIGSGAGFGVRRYNARRRRMGF